MYTAVCSKLYLIFKKLSPTLFSPCQLLIDKISTMAMTHISRTNTFFLVLSFQTEDRGHKCISGNSRVWELTSTTLLPCQPAARAIPLQYPSPPVDLVRMLFISPQTNRIADEDLNYTAPLSHLNTEILLQACNQS